MWNDRLRSCEIRIYISPFDGDNEPLELGMLYLVWIYVLIRCILYCFFAYFFVYVFLCFFRFVSREKFTCSQACSIQASFQVRSIVVVLVNVYN